MKESPQQGEQVTKTQFAEQKLGEYLGLVEARTVDELGEKQTEEVFLWAIRDFKDETISLDDLSFIAHGLWWSEIEKKRGFSKELIDVLLVGGEINFYVRGVLRPEIDTIFLGFLKDVLEFYEEKTKGGAERAE